MLITSNKLFDIFNKKILVKYSIDDLIKLWNIHRGTINRWILKKEIPINYLNHINDLLDKKIEIEFSKKQHFKNMDQFFTPNNLAKELINETITFIKENFEINLKEYSLVEPSAGSGNFYFNFPKNIFKKTIGLDIEPQDTSIKKQDWLKYRPCSKKNIVLGNPPFGLRGQLALQFINHAAEFSDFICFILPPLFNSNGKGSPMFRINKDFYLAKQIEIKETNFLYPDGTEVKVNGIFQIWTKILSPKVIPILPPSKTSEWIKIYSLSNGNTPSSKRNVKMIGNCDYYLPSTTFKEVRLEEEFAKLPHNRGYGIVILKNRGKIKKIIEKIDWQKVSFKSTNSANNLRSQLIIQAIEGKI